MSATWPWPRSTKPTDRSLQIFTAARYVAERERAGVADVAVDVADELQNRGIGTALMRGVIDRARENGFATLTATTLWENRPALAVLRRLGFSSRGSNRAEIEFELALDGACGPGGP